MLDKAPDAFRTISEVAEDLDLPQHVLRFWETRFSQIKPLKRGGGRRYYRPDDVDLLKGIRELLYGQGYTIKGVQRILKSDGVRFVQSVGRGEVSAVGKDLPDDRDGEYADPDLSFDTQAPLADAHETTSTPISQPAILSMPTLSEDDLKQLQWAAQELESCLTLIRGTGLEAMAEEQI